jgi:hypothetical protein
MFVHFVLWIAVYTRMRLLVLSDSHGKGMDQIIEKLDPTWEVVLVRVRKSSAILYVYDIRMEEVKKFKLDRCLFHMGHNDISYHLVLNRAPQKIEEFMSLMLSFMKKVQEDLPDCLLVYSSLFPHTVGPRMSYEEHLAYNTKAVAFGEMVKEVMPPLGFGYVLKQSLWFSVPEGREHPVFFARDGLHLNALGKDFVA